MRPLDWPLLADENIDRRLVRRLRDQGLDVGTVPDDGLVGAPDTVVLAHAQALGRVVLTQDSDFGTLAIHGGEAFVGIIYLRPGNLHPDVIERMLSALARGTTEVVTPFIVVLQRRGDTTRIRIRSAVGA